MDPIWAAIQNATEYVAYSHGNVFLTVLEVRSPRLRCWQIWCLLRACFLAIEGCVLTVTLHGGRGNEALWVSFIRALILCMRTPPSWPNHLPKTPPPKIITLVIRIPTYAFGETHSVYSRSLGNFNLRGYFTNHGERRVQASSRVVVAEMTVGNRSEIFLEEESTGQKKEMTWSYWGTLHGKTRPRDVKCERTCAQNVKRNSQKARFARQITAVNRCKVRNKGDSYGLERKSVHED